MSTGVVTDTGSTISADDRAALRDSITDLIRRRSDSAAVRAAMTRSPRLDAELWATLCTEIGAAALPIPEQYDGAGATFAESAVVLEELGGALAPVPMFSTALATAAILLSGDDDAAARLLPGIASGERIATVCWASAGGWRHPGVRAEARLLSGTAHYVIDGESSDVLLVLAGDGETVTLHEVAGDADGVEVIAQPVLDPTRGLASVTFTDAPATAIPTPAGFRDLLRAHAWALLSAEQVGGAQAALDRSVDYARSRKQFGREIGSFQALKHRMADMYVLVETARSMSRAAVDALVTGADTAPELAASAHVYCSEAYRSVTGDAIQIHGGIGITWEHDIQLYFKRAQAGSQLFGRPSEVVAESTRTLHRPVDRHTAPTTT